jgi:hypothetical protein
MIILDLNEYKDNLIKEINKTQSVHYFTTTRNELRIRCPYCGDSQKDNRHAHLYIQLDNEDTIKYYCQRCNIGGIISSDFLKDIGITNYDLLNDANTISSVYSQNKKQRKDKNLINRFNKSDVIIPDFNNSNASINKLNYINSRYTFDLSAEEYINKYKVIFSFKDFLLLNKITKIDYDMEFINNINKYYIGFLSADKSYIIFRDITNKFEKRYFNFNIFNDYDGKKFFVPSCQLDLFNTDTTLVMSEGIFDIIGIKEYFYKDTNNKNMIFCAVAGKGYNFIINNIARLGFIKMNIKIYSDNDVKINYYKKLKTTNSIMKNNDVEVFYNEIEKDYGVHLNQIQLISNKI